MGPRRTPSGGDRGLKVACRRQDGALEIDAIMEGAPRGIGGEAIVVYFRSVYAGDKSKVTW